MNIKLLDDTALNKARELVKKHVKDGWMVNPDIKVVNGVIKGIFRNNGDCPCVNDSANKQCPCSGYRLHDKCCCQLYVKENQDGR